MKKIFQQNIKIKDEFKLFYLLEVNRFIFLQLKVQLLRAPHLRYYFADLFGT